jgi:adenylate cyclase
MMRRLMPSPLRQASPLLFGLLAGVLMVAVHLTGALDRLQLAAIDFQYKVTDRLDSSHLVVVGVDAQTFVDFEQRKVSLRRRTTHAQMLRRLRRDYRPAAIVYDFQFTERSEDPSLRADDLDLSRAVDEARPVVLVTTEVFKGGRTRVLGGGGVPEGLGAVVANANFVASSDGVWRRLHLVLQQLPTVAAATRSVLERTALPRREPDGERWINFAGPAGTVDELSFSDVLLGRTPREELAGKIVIVGPVASTFQDLHATGSGSEPMTGPEVIANAINTVVQDKPLRSASLPLSVLFILLTGLVASVPYSGIVSRVANWKAALAVRLLLLAAAAGLVVATIVQAFANELILPAADSVAAFVLGSILAGVLSLTTAIQQRRVAEVRARFGRFVPEQVVERVLQASEGSGRLAGVELTATVLFADMRGFTATVERRPASQVIGILDRYLAVMSESIMAQGGTVVSYMGDGIMAVFGAPLSQPDHADRALRAALEMLSTAAPSVDRWVAAEGIELPPVRIGIGLHSGPVASGTVGSERRLEYAVVGDTTNTASRIESMTKELGVPLLVSEATAEHLSPALRDELEDIGVHSLRGRRATVRLWTRRRAEVVGVPTGAPAAAR